MYHEYAARTYEADLRWTLVASGLEALIHTDRHRPTHQFCVRCAALATALEVEGFAGAEAEEAYEMRSGLAHGQSLGTLSPEHFRLYVQMESVLRLALLKAHREPQFAEIFESPATIRQKWPL